MQSQKKKKDITKPIKPNQPGDLMYQSRFPRILTGTSEESHVLEAKAEAEKVFLSLMPRERHAMPCRAMLCCAS